MSDNLKEKLKAAAEFDEQFKLSASYAHCHSVPTENQVKHLSEADKVTFWAGHHSGFHGGAKAENIRLGRLIDAMAEVIAMQDEAISAVHHGHQWADSPCVLCNARAAARERLESWLK